MAKTKDKVYDAAENVKPYVERAMNDEKLRQDELMAAAMLAWHLFPLLEQAGVMKPRPFMYVGPR